MDNPNNQQQAEAIADEASALSNDLSAMAQDIRETAVVVRRNSGVAADTAVESNRGEQLLAQLVQVTNNIGALSQSITNIAKHTNLLALNASIEAVRAGEAGRGFAVVANEVKELASQSAEAASEIQSCIDDITEHGKQAHTMLSEIALAVSGIAERAGNAADGFDRKAAAMDDTAQRMEQLHQQSDMLAQEIHT